MPVVVIIQLVFTVSPLLALASKFQMRISPTDRPGSPWSRRVGFGISPWVIVRVLWAIALSERKARIEIKIFLYMYISPVLKFSNYDLAVIFHLFLNSITSLLA